MRQLLLALAALCAVPTMAQTVSPILQPHQTFVNGAGAACSGCLLYSYAAGTTTPLATYTDSTGGTQNQNPIVLDPAGGAEIWPLTASLYKFALFTATGSPIWTVDNVSSPSGGGGGGGGMVYPAPGIGVSTGAAWRTPTYADVMALWSGCSGGGATFVLFNGQCGSGGATLASNNFIGTQTLLSAGAALTPLVVRQTVGVASLNILQARDTGGTTVNFHSMTTGSTIVIVVMQSDGGATPILSDTLSNVYTTAAQDHLVGSGYLTVLTAPNPNPGVNTVSFANTGSLSSPYMVGYEITGLASVSVVDTTATIQGASLASPQTSGSVTTSASDMILTTLVAYGNSSLSASSSYTNMLAAGATNTSVSAYNVLPSGTYTSAWTNNAAGGHYSMVTVALKVSSSTVQTADLQQWQDTTSTALARIDNVGGIHVPTTTMNGAVWTSGAGAASGNCTVGSIYSNTTAASASTVLYVCQPANTWTAVTVP